MPWRGGAAVVEGGATRGGVTGGVTHAMSGGGGEVQQWWRVGPYGVVSQELGPMPCQVEEGRCSSGGGWGHMGWCSYTGVVINATSGGDHHRNHNKLELHEAHVPRANINVK